MTETDYREYLEKILCWPNPVMSTAWKMTEGMWTLPPDPQPCEAPEITIDPLEFLRWPMPEPKLQMYPCPSRWPLYDWQKRWFIAQAAWMTQLYADLPDDPFGPSPWLDVIDPLHKVRVEVQAALDGLLTNNRTETEMIRCGL